jgi:DNA primase
MPITKTKSSRIHADTIAAVNDKADIVDIVSDRVVLRRSGHSFRGACPFHNGTNPSALSVDSSKNMYYCHNCGAAGGAIKFMMEIGHQSFPEVVLELASRYGIEVKTEEPEHAQQIIKERSHREYLYDSINKVTRFYQNQLSGKALAYLDKRKITKETYTKFKIGYAPAGWDNLSELNIPVNTLEELGLVLPRKESDGHYDRFRDRLIIPIADIRGRVVGFTARSLDGSEPKYINSPETELFKKRELLFGLDQACDAIQKADEAVIVEGHLDVVSLHQNGVTHAVGSMGTALSAAQIKQVLRHTESKRIVCNFDSDKAGIAATKKAVGQVLDLVLDGTVNLRVLTIEGKKDADEYLTSYGSDAYKQILCDAPLYLDWLIDLELKDKDLNDSASFQQANQAIAQTLALLPPDARRSHYTHKCAQKLAQGNARLAVRIEEDLHRALRSPFRSEPAGFPTKTSHTALQLAEMQILKAYLGSVEWRGYIAAAIAIQEIEFSTDEHCSLWQKFMGENFTDLPYRVHDAIAGDVKAVVDRAIAKIQHTYCEKREKYWLELYRAASIDDKPYLQTKLQQEGLRKVGLLRLMTISSC